MSTNDRRGLGVKTRKAEKFRQHNNDLFQNNLDNLCSALKASLANGTPNLYSEGASALSNGDLPRFHNVVKLMNGPIVCSAKIETLNFELECANESTLLSQNNVILDARQCITIEVPEVYVAKVIETVVYTSQTVENVCVSHSEQLNEQGKCMNDTYIADVLCKPVTNIVYEQDIVRENNFTPVELCNIVTCTKCDPLPYGADIVTDSTSLVIYAGPGSGKTTAIMQLDPAFRGSVYDTDHMRPNQIVNRHSVILTNRPEVLVNSLGTKLAFLPFKRHWMKQCLTKCPNAKEKWYHDVCKILKGTHVIRRNCFFRDAIKFQYKYRRRQ